MEVIVLILVAGAVMAVILGGTYLTCQRVQDYCALEAKRAALVSRVLNSRLGKMLRRLNISLNDYMSTFSGSAISRHVDTCQNCEATAACDAHLSGQESNNTNTRDFCPNRSELDRLRDETP